MGRFAITGFVGFVILGILAAGTRAQAPAPKPAAYLVYTGGVLGQLDPCG